MPQLREYHPRPMGAEGYYRIQARIQHRRSLSARVGRAWHRLIALAYRLVVIVMRLLLALMLAALVAAAALAVGVVK